MVLPFYKPMKFGQLEGVPQPDPLGHPSGTKTITVVGNYSLNGMILQAPGKNPNKWPEMSRGKLWYTNKNYRLFESFSYLDLFPQKQKSKKKTTEENKAPCLLGRPQWLITHLQKWGVSLVHGATLADPAHERATVLKNLKANDNNNEDDQYNEDQKKPGK